jgi:hypothetical protein
MIEIIILTRIKFKKVVYGLVMLSGMF